MDSVEGGGVPGGAEIVRSVGAALAAKQAARWMAPASPVFAAEAAPTGPCKSASYLQACESGRISARRQPR
ncbi:hypothetical protein EI693_03720 [Pseudomonas oryziphila]|uniref:Uncharacterized protein n=1 Tax=Pseudomonas oryziphila TaxID=2894079 RepID=A0ABM7CLF9_9PSED|nr:hypothetical protein EI693_03720 [Pseudomonas oryziphila]